MKKYGVILFVLILISCEKRYTWNEKILNAEKIADSNPDSAYNILTSIVSPQKLPKADYAAWCLQYSYCSYKLEKKITDDYLIRIAVDYYKSSHLKKQSGTAYYLLGYFSELLLDDKEAMKNYKEAENVLSTTSEYKLKGLVQFNMGYICMHDEMFNYSLRYFKKSAEFFNKTNEIKYAAYAYREISNMYNQLDYPFDSVMFYSNLALRISKAAGDSSNYYSIISRQGELLYNKDYKLAKEFILKGYRFFPSKQAYYAAYLSYIYLKLNQPDSAKYYMKIALSDNSNSSSKLIALQVAAIVSEESKNFFNAYSYLEKGYMLRDSVYGQIIKSKLHSIDKQYDLTVKEEESARLNIANQTKISWIAFLLVGLLTLVVFFLLAINRFKRKQAEAEIEKKRLQFEKEASAIQNLQKRELLLSKLESKIENTLVFNRLNKGLMSKEKKDDFLNELTKQATLSPQDWVYYTHEVDKLFEGKIVKLKNQIAELTDTDGVVIALICLKISITDACLLLNMSKNTMYVRRKTMKKRLGLDNDIDLEKWLLDYVSNSTESETEIPSTLQELRIKD